MDWADLTMPGRMRAWMVEPNRLDNVLGELTGVKWDAGSIEAGYYTDTRTTAKIVVLDGNWDYRSWIRLTYETEEYSAEVGTYVVTNDPKELKNGNGDLSLAMNSVLWTLAQEESDTAWSIDKGVHTSTLLKRLFEKCGVAYNLAGLKEYCSTQPYTMKYDEKILKWLFDITNYTGNRPDVNGHGTICVAERIAPANIPQAFVFDLEDPRGLVKDGIHRESDWLTTPGRVIVRHQVGSGDNAELIVAHADVSSSNHASYAYRGYLMTKSKNVTDLSPETYEQAQKIADEYLVEQGTPLVEWTFSTAALPIWEGSGVTLLPHDVAYKGARKCFVKSLSITDLHLNRPTMRISAKECASGDKGDE